MVSYCPACFSRGRKQGEHRLLRQRLWSLAGQRQRWKAHTVGDCVLTRTYVTDGRVCVCTCVLLVHMCAHARACIQLKLPY